MAGLEVGVVFSVGVGDALMLVLCLVQVSDQTEGDNASGCGGRNTV